MAALGAHCHPATGGVRFADLNDADKDAVIAGLEDGSVDVGEEKGSCFRQLLKDTRQGFVADPLYGGNRDMVGWKMIGFPGVRHDYRDWVDRHYEPYPRAPIGIADHPKWKED
jgi:gluconate 2-dehydrogenase gamma chain